MRRPGLWVANGQPDDPAQMLSWKPGAITCLYDHLEANTVFDYKAKNPEAVINVRFQHPKDWYQDIEGSARTLGAAVAATWSKLEPLDPYVYFASRLNTHYENGDPNPANQRHYTTREFYQKYGRWLRITVDVIKDKVPDMKLVSPPLAFGLNEDGNPDHQGNPMRGWAGYDFLHETIRDYCDGRLAFQAYWGTPAVGSIPDWLYEPSLSSWYAFRWQRVLELFENRYKLEAQVVIDEAGSFAPDDPDFTDQLIYYARQCLSDERILSISYALWSNPANDPLYHHNAWVENIPHLSYHLERLAEMPDVFIIDPLEDASVDLSGITDFTIDETATSEADLTSLEGLMDEAFERSVSETDEAERDPSEVSERPIRVLFKDGHVEIMPLEEYLRAVVPAEMPALWPFEALKAQAVASRSYAQYAIDHPKFPTADICTTIMCQHYDPQKIHERADKAIRETEGIVVLHRGRTANAVFSANCGGHTRNNEDAWKGSPETYLRGVPCPVTDERNGHGIGLCQYGARALAREGRTYEEILKFYYQGVTVGPTPTL
ncbi:MAG: SpoIID/LytB domain-containing protein [Anaerolineae bacterium]|nr:SpoIID/LytB domain-containing protein [Anaerolineae bacterium]